MAHFQKLFHHNALFRRVILTHRTCKFRTLKLLDLLPGLNLFLWLNRAIAGQRPVLRFRTWISATFLFEHKRRFKVFFRLKLNLTKWLWFSPFVIKFFDQLFLRRQNYLIYPIIIFIKIRNLYRLIENLLRFYLFEGWWWFLTIFHILFFFHFWNPIINFLWATRNRITLFSALFYFFINSFA